MIRKVKNEVIVILRKDFFVESSLIFNQGFLWHGKLATKAMIIFNR